MDDIVLRGMAKWPNVPAVYGWLSLDRRGQWLLKGDRVTNPGIAEFFSRNYSHDEHGRWFLQNGPQRVFVTLDYTPFVYRIAAATGSVLTLTAHTGTSTTTINAAFMDDAGQLLLDTDVGIGLVHDTDLELLIPLFRDANAKTPDNAALATALDVLQAGNDPDLHLQTGNAKIPVQPLKSVDVPARFGFIARPVQPAGEEECY
jgi:hypothetical protein